MCNIVSGTGAMCAANKDWIRDFDIKLFFTRFYKKVLGAKNNWGKYLKRIWRTSVTTCMYPKGTSSKDKEAWKESKGITRKTQDKSKRKSQDASKRKQTVKSRDQQIKEVTMALEISKLKKDGKQIKEIASLLKISPKTVSRYLSKGLY